MSGTVVFGSAEPRLGTTVARFFAATAANARNVFSQKKSASFRGVCGNLHNAELGLGAPDLHNAEPGLGVPEKFVNQNQK